MMLKPSLLVILASCMLLATIVIADPEPEAEAEPQFLPTAINLQTAASSQTDNVAQNANTGKPITDTYIVLVNKTTTVQAAKQALQLWNITNPDQLISTSMQFLNEFSIGNGEVQGFTVRAKYTRLALAQAVLPTIIVGIQQDTMVGANAVQTGLSSTTQWHLPRVNQRDQSTGGTTFYYPNSAGSGVVIYVFSTGVLTTHNDFGGRATWGGVWCSGLGSYCPTSDDNGAGTHHASLAAGTTWGYAKSSTIVALKVQDSTGTGAWSDLLSAMSWATSDCQSRGAKCIFLMPFSGGYTQSVNDAIASASTSGILTVATAGNTNGADTCTISPGSAPSALTVGATTSAGARASYSGTGSCIDMWAPGSSVRAAYTPNVDSLLTMSGTSNSASVGAGIAALEWSRNPSLSPSSLVSYLKSTATQYSGTFDTSSIPNYFVYTNQ